MKRFLIGRTTIKKYFIKTTFFFIRIGKMVYAPHIQLGVKNNYVVGISFHNNNCFGADIMILDLFLHIGIDKYTLQE